MKLIRKVVILFVLMISLLNADGLAQIAQAGSVKITYKVTVSIKKKAKKPYLDCASMTLGTGDTDFIALCRAGNNVKWSASNNNIVSMRKKGKRVYVTGLKPGTVTVKAKYKGRTYRCKVTVVKPEFRCSVSQINMCETQTKIVRTYLNVDAWEDCYPENGDIVECRYSGNNKAGNSYLDWEIKGKKPGKTNVIFTNGYTNEKIIVPVTVIPCLDVYETELIFDDVGQTKSITAFYSGPGLISAKISDVSVVKGKWSGNWNNNITKYNVTAEWYGDTYITFSGGYTDVEKVVKVHVNYPGSFRIKNPNVVIHRFNRNGEAMWALKLNVHNTTISGSNPFFIIKSEVLQEYASKYAYYNDMEIPYKLYRNDILVREGKYKPVKSLGQYKVGEYFGGDRYACPGRSLPEGDIWKKAKEDNQLFGLELSDVANYELVFCDLAPDGSYIEAR